MIYSFVFTIKHKGRKNHYFKFILFQLMYLEHGDKLIMTSGLIHNHILAQFTLHSCRPEVRCIKMVHTSPIIPFTEPMQGGAPLKHLPQDPGQPWMGLRHPPWAWRQEKGGFGAEDSAAAYWAKPAFERVWESLKIIIVIITSWPKDQDRYSRGPRAARGGY